MRLALGAALALAATIIVQWFVMPGVEGRRRHEERWERYVLYLGEHLSFDLPKALTPYVDVLVAQSMHIQSDVPEDARPPLDDERLAARMEALSQRTQALQRFRWLANRVEGYDRYAEGLKPFVRARRDFDETVRATMDDLPLMPTFAEVEARTRAERLQHQVIVQAVSALAELRRPPRRSWRLRMRHGRHAVRWWTRHKTARLTKRWRQRSVGVGGTTFPHPGEGSDSTDE